MKAEEYRAAADAVESSGAEARAALLEAEDTAMAKALLADQIDQLAKFIMGEVPGEPSEDGGAVECAIRIIRASYQVIRDLYEGDCWCEPGVTGHTKACLAAKTLLRLE